MEKRHIFTLGQMIGENLHLLIMASSSDTLDMVLINNKDYLLLFVKRVVLLDNFAQDL